MNAYQKTIEFLSENEGRKMLVGVHAYNICTYMLMENWEMNADGFTIEVGEELGNAFTVIDGDNTEIISCIGDPNKMDVFPETGHFELHTEHATICFELK